VATKTPEELLADAQAILKAARLGARRAFVFELTGTPKAGKTTTLATLHAFFKAAGFRVATLKERAADCPLPMKGHFFFNAWTTCTMLAEVLANHETDVDVLLLDRGFFDALIWLDLQKSRHQVNENEERVFTEFVLLERWRALVDYTIVMQADPAVALERENQGMIIARKGSMMNERALSEFNQAVERTVAKHGARFKHVVIDSTETRSAKESCHKLLETMLPVLLDWSNPKIAVVDKAVADGVFASQAYLDQPEAADALARIFSQVRWVPRVEAEADLDLVQLVVGGVVVRPDGHLLVFRRDRADPKVAAYGEATLWKGCHVHEQDTNLDEGQLIQVLKERLQQELHLETDLVPQLVGVAWKGETSAEGEKVDVQHLGALFKVELPEAAAHSLHQKEFRKSGRGHRFTGQFRSQQEIIEELSSLKLEPWSRHLIENWRIDA
jgi:predicted ATPase